ncbi:N-acetyltransferase 10, partial [Coemansia sp. RSA 353]
YAPVYLRQTSNELTGEYSCVMLRELRTEGLAVAANAHWLDAFARDFHRRFGTLLSFAFSDFTALLALSILDAANSGRSDESRALDAVPYTRADLTRDFSPYDLKRLDSYANNLVDYHVVLDLLPTIAQNFFAARFGAGVSLTGVQQCILLGIGLQHKSVDAVDKEFNLPSRQILAMFTKIMRKVSNYFRNLETSAIAAEIDAKASSAQSTAKRSLTDESAWDPTAMSLEDDLADGGQQVSSELKQRQRELLDAIDMSQYAIAGDEKDWQTAELQVQKTDAQTVVSVKNQQSSKKAKKEKSVVGQLVKSEEARKQKQGKKVKTSKKT